MAMDGLVLRHHASSSSSSSRTATAEKHLRRPIRVRAASIVAFWVASISSLLFLQFRLQFRAFRAAAVYDRVLHGAGKFPAGSREEGEDKAIAFEGGADFLARLRAAHRRKLERPSPECRARSFNGSSAGPLVRTFHRGDAEAADASWIGRSLPAASSSCRFASLSFPPHPRAVAATLGRRVYSSPYHVARQCRRLKYNRTWAATCSFRIGNLPLLGPAHSQEACEADSAGGRHARLWLSRNYNGAAACLARFLRDDLGWDAAAAGGVEQKARRRRHLMTGKEFARLSSDLAPREGYGEASGAEWNAGMLIGWANFTLREAVDDPDAASTAASSFAAAVKAGEGRSNATAFPCIVPLLSFPAWTEGLRLRSLKMGRSPAWLLRTFPSSIGGVLPPSPHLVYSTNAVLDAGVHVLGETYLPACGPWWSFIARADMEKTFFEKGTVGPFASRRRGRGEDAGLRSDVLRACAAGPEGCPFPVHERVVFLAQAHCDELYHAMIEAWPRIAPFLDGVLSEDDAGATSSWSFYFGCDKVDVQRELFRLVGIDDSSALIGPGPVFAKEVVVPTVGHSLAPLLNYWELTSLRRRVEGLHGANSTTPTGGRRSALVLVRDTGDRRRDDDLFDNQFLEGLRSRLSNSHDVVSFRSSDSALMGCLLCQISLFQRADVVMASHGAGLSHLIWAKEGSLLLEVLDKDISTIYAQMAFMVGMKYFPMSKFAGPEDYFQIIRFSEGQ